MTAADDLLRSGIILIPFDDPGEEVGDSDRMVADDVCVDAEGDGRVGMAESFSDDVNRDTGEQPPASNSSRYNFVSIAGRTALKPNPTDPAKYIPRREVSISGQSLRLDLNRMHIEPLRQILPHRDPVPVDILAASGSHAGFVASRLGGSFGVPAEMYSDAAVCRRP